ncbi:MAG: hypothetical protein D8M57_12320 [Candidatus Scalindua sp. AMX11]|nr:MAG: hypothetical protein DWQ00_08940 [Candidatus Scalindua sp.]TDE64634.1 MAG: hypothetical protein D8M57_12320 [Candidatus Scalindua sp. AMX11]
MRKSRTTPFKRRVKKYQLLFGWISACTLIASTILFIIFFLESKFKKEYSTASLISLLLSVTLFLSITALVGYISMLIISKKKTDHTVFFKQYYPSQNSLSKH